MTMLLLYGLLLFHRCYQMCWHLSSQTWFYMMQEWMCTQMMLWVGWQSVMQVRAVV
jgi:hypothetical protein